MSLLPQTHDDDLAWLAFQYVAGEFAPEASTAFEHVLGQDQRAREAVAEAVALMAGVVQSAPALALASRSQPKRWLSSRLRRTVAVALASAACLALAVTPRLIELRARHNITNASTNTQGPGSAVALAWLNLFDEAAETPRPDDTVSAFDDPEADPMTPVETVADRGELVEDLPAWLIEAASLRPSS